MTKQREEDDDADDEDDDEDEDDKHGDKDNEDEDDDLKCSPKIHGISSPVRTTLVCLCVLSNQDGGEGEEGGI